MLTVRTSLLAAGICLAFSTSAFAHAHLLSSSPAMSATVTAAPSMLKLDFSEAIEPSLSGITVTDGDHNAVAIGRPSLAEGNDRELLVPVTGTQAAGTITVDWHAFSKDGHTTMGAFTFSIGK